MNIDDLRSDPIKIESLTHGILEFLELMLKDMSWLDLEQTKKLSAREFIVQLTHTHLLIPKLDTQEIREWEDAELSFVSVKWLCSQWKENALSDAASFDEIKGAIYAYHNEVTAETRKILDDVFTSQKHLIESVSEAIAPSLYLASSNLTSSIAEFTNTINFNLSPLVNNILLPHATLAEQIRSSFTQPISESFSNILFSYKTARKVLFEYVYQGGNALPWRSASLVLEGVWSGKSEKVLSLEALPKQRIRAIFVEFVSQTVFC